MNIKMTNFRRVVIMLAICELFATAFCAAQAVAASARDGVNAGAVIRSGTSGQPLQSYRVEVNGKQYDFAQLLSLTPAQTAGVTVRTLVPFDFKHPGELNDLNELSFIKAQIAKGKEPWASEFDTMKKSSYARLDYLDKMAKPPAIISSGFSGADAHGAFEEMRDANAAYTQALMWYFTGNRAYAINAETILETYASTVTAHEGRNWYLLISWAGAVFPLAADLLHATDPLWTHDRLIARWFNDVFLPPLHDRIAFGNREFAVINAMTAIGVYNDDPAALYEALNHWVNYVPEYYYLTQDGPAPRLADYWTPQVTPTDAFLADLDDGALPKDWPSWIVSSQVNFSVNKRRGKLGDDSTGLRHEVVDKDPSVTWDGAPGTFVNGYTAETARDLGHVDVAFNSTINTAEIAWQQGIDVFTPASTRLTTFMETEAALRMGAPPAASVTTELKPLVMGTAYDIAYNHYHNLEGIALPNTLSLLDGAIWPANGARTYPVAKGDAGRDPSNSRLWKYPAPIPPLFATVISEETGWLSSWQSLTHRDLNAH